MTHEPRAAVELELPKLPPAVIPHVIARGRGWTVAVLGLLILYVGMAICVLVDATTPSGYRGGHLEPGAVWIYPIDDVKFSLTAMTIELVVAALALFVRTRFSIGARAALFGGLYFCVLMGLAPFAMHSTRPFGDHLIYLFFGCCFLVLFSIVSAITAFVRYVRRPLNTAD